MPEISLQELNYPVRCETGLLKRVLTGYDLFDVKTTDDGVLCIYADWLLKDIDKSKRRVRRGRQAAEKVCLTDMEPKKLQNPPIP